MLGMSISLVVESMDSLLTGLTWLTWRSTRVRAGLASHMEQLQWLVTQPEVRLLAIEREAASQGGLTVLSVSGSVIKAESKCNRAEADITTFWGTLMVIFGWGTGPVPRGWQA